jgi:hypothetical protein
MFLAKRCGEDKLSGIAEWVGLRGEWIAQMLNLKRKSMPSHHTYRRTLAEMAIASKQNEITVAPTLLSYLELRNTVVVEDALHTQRQVSIQIGKAGSNFIWTVKANQPQLLQDRFDPNVPILSGMAAHPRIFAPFR